MSTPWIKSYRDAGDRHDPEGMAGRPSAVTPLINRIVLDAVPTGPGDVVVDFGCGDGSLLAQMTSCARRIGVVPTHAEVVALRGLHAGNNIEFLEALAPVIPLPDATASRIVSNGVFLLMPSDDVVRGLLLEMRRVLRPDGLAYVGEVPMAISRLRRLLRRPYEILQTHGPGELARRLLRYATARRAAGAAAALPREVMTSYWTSTPERFCTLAQECGWHVERVSRHEVKLDGRWVEYPRNRFNYLLRAPAREGQSRSP
jgi:SAM-dependent methyltransferase